MRRFTQSTRRGFLRASGIALAAGAGLVRALAEAQGKTAPAAPATSAGAGADLPLVDEKSALAATLKYKHDGASVPAGLKVAKAGIEGAKQSCANCMFYTKVGKAGGDEAGKCQLFAQGHVKAKGWCSSWTKKP